MQSSRPGIAAAGAFSLDVRAVSYDTTSTSVWGEYRPSMTDPPAKGPLVTFGHSKDNQPQLKQFMTELLCVERGIRLCRRQCDGRRIADPPEPAPAPVSCSSWFGRTGVH
jgi:transposase